MGAWAGKGGLFHGTINVRKDGHARMSTPNVILWLERHQVDLVAAVARQAKFSIVGAGSPTKGQSGAMAASLGCEVVDDLRAALASAACDAILLFSLGDFSLAPAGQDAGAVLAAKARNVRVLSLEPVPSSAMDLAGHGWTREEHGQSPASAIRFIGLPRLSRVMRDAHEPLAAMGRPRTLHIEAYSNPVSGSLASRLFAAVDLSIALLGEPEIVDASFVSAAGVRASPPQTLANLDGDLSILARYPDGRSSTICASNQGGTWMCTATLLGERGRLRLFDDGLEWIDPSGAKVDELRQRRGKADSSLDTRAIKALADSLSRLLDSSIPDEGPAPIESILCVAQAALLSARTGQPESPATIRRAISPTM